MHLSHRLRALKKKHACIQRSVKSTVQLYLIRPQERSSHLIFFSHKLTDTVEKNLWLFIRSCELYSYTTKEHSHTHYICMYFVWERSEAYNSYKFTKFGPHLVLPSAIAIFTYSKIYKWVCEYVWTIFWLQVRTVHFQNTGKENPGCVKLIHFQP